ncbi:MAG TPA: hypothetical protein VK934_03790, partial [Fimbriimonas sp.]|nr:hypothetical protein [Fimbriimonas sp.]
LKVSVMNKGWGRPALGGLELVETSFTSPTANLLVAYPKPVIGQSYRYRVPKFSGEKLSEPKTEVRLTTGTATYPFFVDGQPRLASNRLAAFIPEHLVSGTAYIPRNEDDCTLSVQGSGFVPDTYLNGVFVKGSRVYVNNTERATRFEARRSEESDATQYDILRVKLNPQDLASERDLTVVVVNPGAIASAPMPISVVNARPPKDEIERLNFPYALLYLTKYYVDFVPNTPLKRSDFTDQPPDFVLEGGGFCAASEIYWDGTRVSREWDPEKPGTLKVIVSKAKATVGSHTVFIKNPSIKPTLGGGTSNTLTVQVVD